MPADLTAEQVKQIAIAIKAVVTDPPPCEPLSAPPGPDIESSCAVTIVSWAPYDVRLVSHPGIPRSSPRCSRRRPDAGLGTGGSTSMLWPALPGVAETRPNYPRDVFRRYTAHDVAMQRGFELERTSSTRPRAVLSCRPPTDQMRNGLRAQAEDVPTRHKHGLYRSVAGSPTATQKGAVRGVEDVSTSSGAERENRTGVWPAYGRWKTNCCVGC